MTLRISHFYVCTELFSTSVTSLALQLRHPKRLLSPIYLRPTLPLSCTLTSQSPCTQYWRVHSINLKTLLFLVEQNHTVMVTNIPKISFKRPRPQPDINNINQHLHCPQESARTFEPPPTIAERAIIDAFLSNNVVIPLIPRRLNAHD